MPIYVARQPILDRGENLYGYELLFRSSDENRCPDIDGELATSSLISNAIHYLKLDELVNHKRAFVNMTRELLEREVYMVLPCENTVLELLETVPVDEAVIKAFQQAKDAGYMVALDDVRSLQCPNELLALADIVKVDLMEIDSERSGDIVKKVRDRSDAKLLAEKVETREEFEAALALGYDYFQGYYFNKPELIKGQRLAGIERSHLALLEEVNKPQLDMDAIEEVIKQDPSQTTNLLRFINSSAMGVRNKITSMKLALNLLGEKTIRKWSYVAVVGCLVKGKPSELLRMCMVRARFCERLAVGEQHDAEQLDLFLLGLGSLLEGIMNQPIADIVRQIDLPSPVVATLTNTNDAPFFYVTALNLAKACETGDWQQVIENTIALKQQQAEVAVAYYDSMNWANQVMSGV